MQLLPFPRATSPHVKLPFRLHLFVCVIHDQEKTLQEYRWFSVKQELVAIQLPWAEIHTTICECLAWQEFSGFSRKDTTWTDSRIWSPNCLFWLEWLPKAHCQQGWALRVPLTLDSSCPGPPVKKGLTWIFLPGLYFEKRRKMRREPLFLSHLQVYHYSLREVKHG